MNSRIIPQMSMLIEIFVSPHRLLLGCFVKNHVKMLICVFLKDPIIYIIKVGSPTRNLAFEKWNNSC